MIPHPRLKTPLCDLLGCEVPVMLAGMGGVSRWELAAAVANAGGYAQLGMVREDPALIASEIKALRAATTRPFAVRKSPGAAPPGGSAFTSQVTIRWRNAIRSTPATRSGTTPAIAATPTADRARADSCTVAPLSSGVPRRR